MVKGESPLGDLLDRPGQGLAQGLLEHRPTGLAEGHQRHAADNRPVRVAACRPDGRSLAQCKAPIRA